jgi:hypothetical protein
MAVDCFVDGCWVALSICHQCSVGGCERAWCNLAVSAQFQHCNGHFDDGKNVQLPVAQKSSMYGKSCQIDVKLQYKFPGCQYDMFYIYLYLTQGTKYDISKTIVHEGRLNILSLYLTHYLYL